MSCAILWGSLLANERTSETRRTNPTRASIIPGRAQDHYTRATTRALYQGDHKGSPLLWTDWPGKRIRRTQPGRALYQGEHKASPIGTNLSVQICVMGRCGGQNGSHSRFTTMKRKTSTVGAIPCGRPVRVVARFGSMNFRCTRYFIRLQSPSWSPSKRCPIA